MNEKLVNINSKDKDFYLNLLKSDPNNYDAILKLGLIDVKDKNFLSAKEKFKQLIKMADILEKLEVRKNIQFLELLNCLSCEDLITLQKFSGNGILSVLTFIGEIELRGKKLRYILQILDEVSRFQETSAGVILDLRQFREILWGKNIQNPERYRLIKELLNSIRYPKLYDLRKKFAQR